MDILLSDFPHPLWREVTPLLDWAVTNWALTFDCLSGGALLD
jgi:hypothetical protein